MGIVSDLVRCLSTEAGQVGKGEKLDEDGQKDTEASNDQQDWRDRSLWEGYHRIAKVQGQDASVFRQLVLLFDSRKVGLEEAVQATSASRSDREQISIVNRALKAEPTHRPDPNLWTHDSEPGDRSHWRFCLLFASPRLVRFIHSPYPSRHGGRCTGAMNHCRRDILFIDGFDSHC